MASKDDKHNTEYVIKISSPLVRSGLEIEAGPVSEDYVVPTVSKLMEKVRKINQERNN